MKLEVGYVYHIKEEYFKVVKDSKLMVNHEGNNTRPNYFCIKKEDSDLLWFIPMSSKIEKYKKIINDKITKYGKCDTIVIGNYRNREQAFLIQNIFPITEKYIDHIDTANGKAIQVASETRREIVEKVKLIFKLKDRGINLIFPNVDEISKQLERELEQEDLQYEDETESEDEEEPEM